MVAAQSRAGHRLSISSTSLPDAVPIANLWLGLGKGVVFGVLIALVACHFGLRIEPNTESLGIGTTNSVVTSITVVIIVDAMFAMLFASRAFHDPAKRHRGPRPVDAVRRPGGAPRT